MDSYQVQRRENPFVQVDKGFIADPEIGFREKGILLYFLSKPPGWRFTEADIAANATDGLTSVRSGIKKLMETGYIARKRAHDEMGRFSGFEYTVYEMKQDIGPNPPGEEPDDEQEEEQIICDDEMAAGVVAPHETPEQARIRAADALFEEVWLKYPEKKGKARVSITHRLRLLAVGREQLLRCIARYIESKPIWRAYQHGGTFFNSGYVDYLDENYEQDTSRFTHDSKPYEHAKLLDDLISGRLKGRPASREQTLQEWARMMNDLNTQGYPWHTIRAAIELSQNDDYFRRVIVDGQALCQRFDQISAKVSDNMSATRDYSYTGVGFDAS